MHENWPAPEVQAKLRYRYTCPARENGAYLPQWLWDSCFHALAYRWFDPGMAWEELRSLLVHQETGGDDAGMIPHMSHLDENGDLASQALFGRKDASFLTQPPLVSIAALAIHKRSPDKAELRSLFPGLLAYHAWFDRRRDPDGDSLVSILHPWESGWDASQRWDGPMGRSGDGAAGLKDLETRRKVLAALVNRYGRDARALSEAPGGFVIEPPDFNAIRAADLSALSAIASELSEPGEADELESRALLVRRAVCAKMLEEKDGRLRALDLIGPEERKGEPDHAGKFILLFGRCLTEPQARAMADQLRDPKSGYATPFPVPSIPFFHKAFDGDEYWRGNVWLSINWLIYRGLLEYGLKEDARLLARKSLELVAKSGFREFFNPLTGAGGKKFGRPCPFNYGWSTIILDMLLGDGSG